MEKFTPLFFCLFVFLFAPCCKHVSAVRLGVLIWGSTGTSLLLEPASSGHLRNCNLWHFCVCLIFTVANGLNTFYCSYLY